jgi:hypothetical protein
MKSQEPCVVTLSHLGQLPLRANVAFAVRCAQRIRPRFLLPEDAPRRREQFAAVDGAIRVAAAFCRGLSGAEPGRAEEAARRAAIVAEETGQMTSYAGYAAAHAARAAADAEEVAGNKAGAKPLEVVAAAFGAGRVLAANAGAFDLHRVAAALYADVQKLLSMAQSSCEELGSPVDPGEDGPLGALWPDGTPVW